jgi:hypothetical protein
MEKFQVNKNALLSYMNFFHKNLEEDLIGLYNDDFVLVNGAESYSFIFLDDSILVLKVVDSSIEEILSFSYEFFVSDKVIKEISNLAFVPPRLQRYIGLGETRLKHEIKQNLILGNIHVENGKALWEGVNYCFTFDSNNRLDSIEDCYI